jgi:hypothetical protein
VDSLISVIVVAPKTVFCFVVLSFTEKFLGGSFDVMISLFLIEC